MPSNLFTLEKRIRLAETDSTNADALQLLPQQPAEGTLIQADFQRKGRGQKGNIWTAAPGVNLMFSLILYPHFLPLNRVFQLSKAVSLALLQAVQRFIPDKRLQIKWPNDLLLEGKKVAGILIENQLEGSTLKSGIIGIGLNVNQAFFSPELNPKACSMRQYVSMDLDRDAILSTFLEQFSYRYHELQQVQYERLDRDYYDQLYGYQETIPLADTDGSFEGQIIGLDPQGRLAVQKGEALRYYGFKEVQFFLP